MYLSRSKPVLPRLLLVLGLLVQVSSVHANSIEALTTHPLIKDIRISPGGDHLAVLIFHEDTHTLRFMDRKTLSAVGGFGLSGAREVGDFHWVNNERVVGSILEVRPGEDRPISYGELFGVNYDGSRREWLFGARAGSQNSGLSYRARKAEAELAWATMIDPLVDDPDYVLISSTPMSRSQDRRSFAVKLNAYNGYQSSPLAMSKFGMADFLTDREGSLRLVRSLTADDTPHLQSLPREASEWIDLPAETYTDGVRPFAITEDQTAALVLDSVASDKVGLYKLALDGSGYTEVYSHKRVDITDVVVSTDGRSIYAMRIDDGYPSYLLLPSEHPEAGIFKRLLATFAGSLVSITSHSRDGRYWVVNTATDVSQGRFYLFDKDKDQLIALADTRPGVDPATLASMEPISFTSFDGKEIAGYLTRAKAEGDAAPPLVVLVHGGPVVRDTWGYDSEVQALATHGYSVLQINFRGSSGYGRAFLEAGVRQWGDQVQRDIIAGTHWAIKQGIAEPGKVCIMGTSFGAYSAVQSATMAPDLYACVIANAGVYDLSLLYKKGDIQTLYWGDAFIEKQVGSDKAELARYSPVNNVASLKAPVLIAHGTRDQRTPFEHAKALKAAMDKNKKDYEWFIKSGEGHGFYSNENRVEFLTRSLQFLAAHLGD